MQTDKKTYSFMGDEAELKWFFENIIEKPESHESYLMCISSRSKKISEEDRKKLALARGEMMREQIITTRGKEQIWDFEWFKSFIYRYEFPYEGMVTKTGYPYPQESLVMYFYVNPSDEHKVMIDNMTHANSILNDLVNACTKMSKDGIREQLYKLRTIDTHKKTCRATNISRHLWTQFDFDMSDDIDDMTRLKTIKETIRETGNFLFGKGHVVIVRTSGGFHVLVHRNGLKYWNEYIRKTDSLRTELDLPENKTLIQDPITQFIFSVNYRLNKISTDSFTKEPNFRWFNEWTKTEQSFLPLPGTLQYGNFVVRVLNKEDFVGTTPINI